MGMLSLLTLEKLKDKRFYETERAIFLSVAREGAEEMEEILVAAKISRATFYRHHRAVYAIERDYEELVKAWTQQKVEEVMGRVEGKKKGEGGQLNGPRRLKRLYFETIMLMYRRQELFRYFLARGNVRVYHLLMEELKPAVIEAWGANVWLEKLYEIYVGEVVGVILVWSKNGFHENEIAKVLKDIMYLTITVRERLGRMMRED